jgi:predicted alpha/beta-hydrolase family hydrolase
MTPLAFSLAAGDAAMATLYEADRAAARNALFVFAHGAGAGQSHPFMVRYARGLAERGLDVVTFDFPYRHAGRKTPDRAPVLEEAFRQAIVAAAGHRHVRANRILIGGKSMGGRIATHLAASPETWPSDIPLGGVIVFGYPLRPPGSAARSPDRVSHLFRIAVPTLIVQGTRDTFGGPDAIAAALADPPAGATLQPFTVHPVAGGDHSLNVGSKRSADAEVWDRVAAFVAAFGR